MKTTLKSTVLAAAACLLFNPAHAKVVEVPNAPSEPTSSSANDKAAAKAEHGATVAVDGMERGTNAALRGIERGAKAAANGIERGAQATGRALNKVGQKIGISKPAEGAGTATKQ